MVSCSNIIGGIFMRKKSLAGLALTLIMCLMASTSAMAATGLSKAEESILDNLKAGVEVNGKVVAVPASYINQAKNELMKNDVDITAKQAATINEKIDEAAAIVKKEKITKASDLKNSKEVNKVVELTKEAAGVAGYTVSYDAASGIVKVLDPDGNVVFTTKNVINQTGFDMQATAVAGIAFVTLLAACILVADRKKLFAGSVQA
jgi:hypothetical protein